jgi:hypothetical protein
MDLTQPVVDVGHQVQHARIDGVVRDGPEVHFGSFDLFKDRVIR